MYFLISFAVIPETGPISKARSMKLSSSRTDFWRSEERRVGKECVVRVDLGGRRIIKKKIQRHDESTLCHDTNTIKYTRYSNRQDVHECLYNHHNIQNNQ